MRLDDDVPGDWTVLVPVKSLAHSKTRLDPSRVGIGPALALGFLLDSTAAAVACPAVSRVVVVSADPSVADAAAANGCLVADDAGGGINAAATAAAARLAGPVAVMVSDLPALTPDALAAVLSSARPHGPSFLPDADGAGTTLWLSPTAADVAPRFGPGSARAHSDQGAADLSAVLDAPVVARVRADVDTVADLARAWILGVGAATREVARAHGLAVLVTVVDRADEDVTVLDETGSRYVLAWPAFAAAGFRHLRAGQRVRLDVDGNVALP